MPKVEKAIELLQCAEINCDNVKKLGTFFVDAVKLQIKEAIMLLTEEADIPCSLCGTTGECDCEMETEEDDAETQIP